MAVSINDILRAASVWKYAGTDEQVNVFHLKVNDPGTGVIADVMLDVAQFFLEGYATVVGNMANNLTHDRIQIQNMTTSEVYGATSAVAALDGASGDEPAPPQLTALLLMNTVASRRQGRVYIPSFGEGSFSSGSFATGVVANIETLGDYLLDEHEMDNGTVLQYVVFKTNVNYLIPISRRAVNGARVQRRRQLGRGS